MAESTLRGSVVRPGGLAQPEPPAERRHLPRSRQFWAGSIIVTVAVMIAIAAPLLTPYDPLAQDIYAAYEAPSLAHPLGLDDYGRDMLSRLIAGSRITLLTGVLAVAISLPLGMVIGAWLGFRRGWTDIAIMRVLDVQMAYPGVLLALVLIVSLGASQRSVILALAIGGIPHFARIVRAAVMHEASLEYVTGARAIGQRESMILFRHIGPNVIGLMLVHGAFGICGAMVGEASLSFLGLGADPSQPSWGRMLSSGTQSMYIAEHIVIIPIVVLSVITLGWYLLGEGLRAWLDPRQG